MFHCVTTLLVAVVTGTVYCTALQIDDDNASEMSKFYENSKVKNLWSQPTDCSVTVDDTNPYDILRALDDKFQPDRASNDDKKLDEYMTNELVRLSGKAPRAQHESHVRSTMVPAGLNLGGYCRVMHDNMAIFFHRMKLRNDTVFSIESIRNQLDRKLVYIALDLNDLHLQGSFERAMVNWDTYISSDLMELYYMPTFGIADFLLKGVKYLVQGRYRVIGDQLSLDMINSEIIIEKSLLSFKTKNGENVTENSKESSKNNELVEVTMIDDFIERMKVDLNDWLKDFLNDVLTYSKEPVPQVLDDKQKTLALNKLADSYIAELAGRQRARDAAGARLPRYTIHSIVGTRVELSKGSLLGLGSMHRRSAATSVSYAKGNGTVRGFDVVVGFSDLSLIYGASVHLPSFGSSKGNRIILTANDLAAHMEVLLGQEPRQVQVNFNFLRQMKPEFITLDGPISRDIANFKHLLELHVTTLMLNEVLDNIKNLKNLTECGPGASKVNNTKPIDSNKGPYAGDNTTSLDEGAADDAQVYPPNAQEGITGIDRLIEYVEKEKNYNQQDIAPTDTEEEVRIPTF